MTRILVVDDCWEEVEMLIHLLTRQGWDVLYAESGEEAIQIINQEKITCVIADLEITEMTGHQLMEKVYDDPANEDIAFLLAHYDWMNGMFSRPTKSGRTAGCHLMKPYTFVHISEICSFMERVFSCRP
jgi:CheY-like chemotaxis protein